MTNSIKDTIKVSDSSSNNSGTVSPTQEELRLKEKQVERLQAGIFFAIATSFGILSGFGFSVGATKKREIKDLDGKELRDYYARHERGVEFAKKALTRATLYSVGGFSLFCFTIWKLSGASNFQEFRYKVGTVLPKLSKPTDKIERTEFENLTDLLQYVIDEDKKKRTK
jgi:hypothetical protein